MKQHILRFGLIFVLTALVVFTQTSCKERTILGQNMNLTNDNVNITEVFLTANTKTYYDSDILPTSFQNSGYFVYAPLGTINADPVFGKTYADVYFQVVPSIVGISDFSATGLTPDSAELIIPYTGFSWGDTSNLLGYNQQKVQAYRMLHMREYSGTTDSFYYASNTEPLGEAISAPTTFNIKGLGDSVMINGVNHAPHISLKLTNAFVNYLKNGGSNYQIASYFTQYLQGICVKTIEGTPSKALPYMRLDALDANDIYAEAGVLMHCHSATSASDTIITYYFDPGTCGHFSNVRRDYKGTQVLNNLDTKVYLQNAPGAGIDVVIRGINALPKSIINKAELQITPIPSGNGRTTDSILFAPSMLSVTKIVNGVPTQIDDRFPLALTSPLEVIDGYTHAISYAASTSPSLPALTTTTYTINMPRELQAAMSNGSDTIHLHINGTSDYIGAYRLVAAGGNYTNGADNRMRLKMRVVYSLLR